MKNRSSLFVSATFNVWIGNDRKMISEYWSWGIIINMYFQNNSSSWKFLNKSCTFMICTVWSSSRIMISPSRIQTGTILLGPLPNKYPWLRRFFFHLWQGRLYSLDMGGNQIKRNKILKFKTSRGQEETTALALRKKKHDN